MTIVLPTYCTREAVKQALDIKMTNRSDQQVDDSIEEARDSVEGLLHRKFYTVMETRYFDWPNFQSAFPWRIWFDASEIADVTVNVPTVTSGGNLISNSDIFWGHPTYVGAPYEYFELNRSSNASFGQGDTPQRDVAITASYGFWDRFTPAGALAANMSDTTGTVATVTDGSKVGVGDVFVVGTERMLVTGKNMVDTTQAQIGSGVSTASFNDQTLQVTDGTKFSAQEVLLLNAERMLIVDIAGNNLIVKRAWDGSTIATHTGAEIYAARLLTVTRGDLGTTAATHLSGDAATVAKVPGGVQGLALAYSLNSVLQKPAGYSITQVNGAGAAQNIGISIAALEKKVLADFGRKARTRVV